MPRKEQGSPTGELGFIINRDIEYLIRRDGADEGEGD